MGLFFSFLSRILFVFVSFSFPRLFFFLLRGADLFFPALPSAFALQQAFAELPQVFFFLLRASFSGGLACVSQLAFSFCFLCNSLKGLSGKLLFFRAPAFSFSFPRLFFFSQLPFASGGLIFFLPLPFFSLPPDYPSASLKAILLFFFSASPFSYQAFCSCFLLNRHQKLLQPCHINMLQHKNKNRQLWKIRAAKQLRKALCTLHLPCIAG